MKPFEDTDIMPFGKHQGKKLIDVPADYLIWLYENNQIQGRLKLYVLENMNALEKEIKDNKQ